MSYTINFLQLGSTMKRNLLLAIFILSFCMNVQAQNQFIVLGRPTDNSITASILFNQSMEYYLEYGTQTGIYSSSTATFINTAGVPDEIDLTNLSANTRYYYRMHYRFVGISAYSITSEYSFITQRLPGSTFTFTLESDEHLYDKKGVNNMYKITLQNQALDNPDFMMSLGDIFGDDHTPSTTTLADMDSLHKDYRPFLGSICHSVPFYVCLGNHEGENDYYLASNPPNNIAVYGTLARKKYYPNPFPNSFYSGDTVVEGFGMGVPENYYAWNWGDALFIVLDVYRTESYSNLDPKPVGWNWTLGATQYEWLKNTLQNSTATHKFVFAHHIRGQGRGGITNAKLFEWGGLQNLNGANTFAANRPGWAMPIHDLFVNYGVNIFFQGHDHVFAHEILDSVTYQALPMAADSTYEIGKLANAGAYTSDTLDGTGHLRVMVSPNCVQVDFVRAYLPADTVSGVHHNREVAFSYSLGACATTGISKIHEKNWVSIYPNPSKNILNFLFSDKQNEHHLKLMNTLGETLIETQSEMIDISGVEDGIYFVKIHSGQIQITKKVIVHH